MGNGFSAGKVDINQFIPASRSRQSRHRNPADQLRLEKGEWTNTAHIYALDSTTIAIASHEKPEWKETAAFTAEIPIRKEKRKVILKVPEKLNRSYGISRSW